ncbi:hypothetical protein BJV82DRAFT_612257 [Fennellomyces sp. T-0311]|nr:hypothetical protein BJV82DRAFT_612257 [Fennellomyces sp. T-0311]
MEDSSKLLRSSIETSSSYYTSLPTYQRGVSNLEFLITKDIPHIILVLAISRDLDTCVPYESVMSCLGTCFQVSACASHQTRGSIMSVLLVITGRPSLLISSIPGTQGNPLPSFDFASHQTRGSIMSVLLVIIRIPSLLISSIPGTQGNPLPSFDFASHQTRGSIMSVLLVIIRRPSLLISSIPGTHGNPLPSFDFASHQTRGSIMSVLLVIIRRPSLVSLTLLKNRLA